MIYIVYVQSLAPPVPTPSPLHLSRFLSLCVLTSREGGAVQRLCLDVVSHLIKHTHENDMRVVSERTFLQTW